jgi:3-methylcrotonyl-CoA carboxylase beta subunit
VVHVRRVQWYSHAQDKRAAKGGVLTAEEETAMKAPLLARLDTENSAYYSTARLWDDGVIDPRDTRYCCDD